MKSKVLSVVFLCCDATWTHRQIPMLLRNILSPTPALKNNNDIFTTMGTSNLKSTVHYHLSLPPESCPEYKINPVIIITLS